ncbi:NAD(P)/FAD-dependent oxidoreductase [Fulvivirga lutimaris]|uniref:NAD(P)/FAD-dependent oxidoreductase n=1 Tax=Fulvivirga lutimaris TaxID=1819566 RepID=UPI0012BC59F2|nr:NAD(P)/FAD-dependent oxidoreductase [Fulvivirga lutimaris]MTI38801.1 NAD(P)/FAD-dependent oxidoreductase [Fulvivirga lutimaris]
MKVAVIGGGAAGFFAAISCKTHHPKADVVIYEKGSKLLAKVKVSGGGRCNVTHQCFDNKKLSTRYPRGEKFLKKAFNQFAVEDTINWFGANKVIVKAENDGRMFPITDDSQTIIDALTSKVKQLGITINLQQTAAALVPREQEIVIVSKEGVEFSYDKVIVATGGSPKVEGLKWLEALGHNISTPVPSLFTFNMPNEPVKALMGVAVESATVKVQGTKLKQSGPLLITHWGMSGPAVLKTSAWGARELSNLGYTFKIQVNWVDDKSENDLRTIITEMQQNNHKRMVANKNAFGIPSRLWEFLLAKIDLRSDITWGEMGQKGVNKLVNVLMNDIYQVEGKTTFKDEFVTCGGVSLSDINNETMESKQVPGLYFTGEVMDIDGITGGFNFQAAWTTGWIAGKLN